MTMDRKLREEIVAEDVKKFDHYEFERIKVADPLTIAFKRTK